MVQICDQILINGVCPRDGCTARHDIHSCQLCRVQFSSREELEQHFVYPIHKKRVIQNERRNAGLNQAVRCTVCPVDLPSISEWPTHARGRRHQNALREQGIENDPGPEELEVPHGSTRCDVCDTNIPTTYWFRHVNGPRHTKAKGYVALKSALDEAERDKNGIAVSDGEGGLEFGILEPQPGVITEYDESLFVHNTNSTPIVLKDTRITSHHTSREHISHFYFPVFTKHLRIAPGARTNVPVTFAPREERGRFEDRIELIFEDPTLEQHRFAITRPVRATVGVKADYDILRPKAPYVRPKRKVEEPITDIIPGIAPPALSEIQWQVKLGMYPIPPGLTEMAYGSGSPSDIARRIRENYLPNTFDSNTFGRHFRVLLWIEEERARRDLQQYNMENVTLDPQHPYYRLEVEGLAEKRPSIIVTDRIFVRNYGSSVPHWFEGCVHRVHEKTVDLRFSDRFNSYKGQKYNVRFDLNRLTLRRMHQALGTALTRSQVLFPTLEHVESLRPPTAMQMTAIRCVDRKVGTNPPQLQAVATILHRPRGSVPFVVFGPPGTGKTVTIIESIRQILLADPSAHILACAPSNSAADLIAERLEDLGKTQIFRLNAPSRENKRVSATIRRLSLMNRDDVFCVPPVVELRKFRVVVSTCFSASVPYGVGVPRGHFSHIFIDEAGQACEPEVMIPIKTMADNSTNVILSGDTKQLGPIVRSPVARELGLGKSYLDRLMANPVYDEDTGSGISIVKLIKNWRSHSAILKFPNSEFYRGELEACGDPAVTESLLRFEELVTPRFPIIFHGIAGKDEREASSPSFFNIDEASLVKFYVQELFEDQRLRLTPQNIGIISPYNAQVGKIRMILSRNVKAKEIKVGSVEEFQGQERRVIIISTVRSSVDLVNFDLRHTLGFVANPRRFNVAVTRAQALLIVIGDPLVLSLDPLWKSFINYVHIGGGCKGRKIDWDPTEPVDRAVRQDEPRRLRALTEMDELIERTRSLIIGQSENLAERDDDDELEGNVDKPWREDE